MWRCHACAIHTPVVAERNGADDFFTRRYQIRFQSPVSGRATTRKITDAKSVRTLAMSGAHSDNTFGVTRIGNADAAVTLLFNAGTGQEIQIPVVAGGGYHHHARAHRLDAPVADQDGAVLQLRAGPGQHGRPGDRRWAAGQGPVGAGERIGRLGRVEAAGQRDVRRGRLGGGGLVRRLGRRGRATGEAGAAEDRERGPDGVFHWRSPMRARRWEAPRRAVSRPPAP